MNTYRPLAFIIAFVSILVFPWFVSGLFLLFLTIYFNFYFEGLVLGFIIDLLYFPNTSFLYPALIASFLAVLLVTFVKTRIRT